MKIKISVSTNIVGSDDYRVLEIDAGSSGLNNYFHFVRLIRFTYANMVLRKFVPLSTPSIIYKVNYQIIWDKTGTKMGQNSNKDMIEC